MYMELRVGVGGRVGAEVGWLHLVFRSGKYAGKIRPERSVARRAQRGKEGSRKDAKDLRGGKRNWGIAVAQLSEAAAARKGASTVKERTEESRKQARRDRGSKQ